MVIRFDERCAIWCIGPTRNYLGMEEVRYISTHPSSSQPQERFRVTFVFWSTGWGIQKFTKGEIVGATDLPFGPITETFSRATDKSNMLLTSFLKLPPVKALIFLLAVGLCIGRTISSSQKNNGLMTLHPIYIFRYDNYFRINLQSRQTKADNEDNVEIETAVWNNAAAEVFQEGYRAKRHELIFHHLRNIMAMRFKYNVDISIVRYMVDNYCTSRSLWHGESRKEVERHLKAGLESQRDS